MVEEMVRLGTLRAEEVSTHRLRHVITNAVGGNNSEVTVEIHKVQLEAGDSVLLCSDGLTNMVSDEEMSHILQTHANPEQACRELVDQANDKGGQDNIPVIVAQFGSAA